MKIPWMSRRRFLLSIIVGLVPSALAWTAWTTPSWLRRAAIEELVGDLSGARAIGTRYLVIAPEERDAAFLARHLFAGVADGPHHAAGMSALRQAIGAHRQRDFTTGDTVIIDGWILARTEARLCALAALS